MGPTEVKFITDLAAALGVPGGIIVALWMVYQSNRGKAKDPAADVLDALTKIEDAVDAIDSRLIRVETRQEMLLGRGVVQHHTDRTMPPR